METLNQNEDSTDLITNLQEQKLRLEILQLDANKSFGYKLVRYIPIISAFVAVAGFLLGIYTFNSQKEKDFKNVFWEKQLLIYSEISNSASRLATLEDDGDIKKEYQKFKELYHGTLIMFMDDSVANAVKSFVEVYIDYQNDPKKQINVQEKSRFLANACRRSLLKNWNIPLNDIDLRRYQ